MSKLCASCFDSSVQENVTSEEIELETRMKTRGFLLSDVENHDDETDLEAPRTTQV